jgi:hypothetical protein
MDPIADYILCSYVRVFAFEDPHYISHSSLSITSHTILGAASFTIYTGTKDYFQARNWLARDSMLDAALVGGISGATAGSLISFGSTRTYCNHGPHDICTDLAPPLQPSS